MHIDSHKNGHIDGLCDYYRHLKLYPRLWRDPKFMMRLEELSVEYERHGLQCPIFSDARTLVKNTSRYIHPKLLNLPWRFCVDRCEKCDYSLTPDMLISLDVEAQLDYCALSMDTDLLSKITDIGIRVLREPKNIRYTVKSDRPLIHKIQVTHLVILYAEEGMDPVSWHTFDPTLAKERIYGYRYDPLRHHQTSGRKPIREIDITSWPNFLPCLVLPYLGTSDTLALWQAAGMRTTHRYTIEYQNERRVLKHFLPGVISSHVKNCLHTTPFFQRHFKVISQCTYEEYCLFASCGREQYEASTRLQDLSRLLSISDRRLYHSTLQQHRIPLVTLDEYRDIRSICDSLSMLDANHYNEHVEYDLDNMLELVAREGLLGRIYSQYGLKHHLSVLIRYIPKETRSDALANALVYDNAYTALVLIHIGVRIPSVWPYHYKHLIEKTSVIELLFVRGAYRSIALIHERFPELCKPVPSFQSVCIHLANGPFSGIGKFHLVQKINANRCLNTYCLIGGKVLVSDVEGLASHLYDQFIATKMVRIRDLMLKMVE